MFLNFFKIIFENMKEEKKRKKKKKNPATATADCQDKKSQSPASLSKRI